jgi:hypothetical protein
VAVAELSRSIDRRSQMIPRPAKSELTASLRA